ncbi:MAG: phosphonate ABC transporter ATP-binding protein [Gammaproteobacteria bacterium]
MTTDNSSRSEAPAIEFRDLDVRFADGTQALRDVRLSVPRGQFCVVLGPSGAGKSTLLRAVNGLVTAGRGRVEIAGTELTTRTLRTLRPRMAMIHQQFNLVTRASVAANVLSGASPAVPTWRVLLQWYPKHFRDKACELLADVGLESKHLQRRVSTLSGGQQQRVGIARAFMLDPIVMLADEPVASLDPRISRETLELLKRESQQRRTTVLCSLHQIDLAREFGDRIIALRQGVVAFDGAPGAFTDSVVDRVYGTDATRTGRLTRVQAENAGVTATRAVVADATMAEPRKAADAVTTEPRKAADAVTTEARTGAVA